MNIRNIHSPFSNNDARQQLEQLHTVYMEIYSLYLN